MSFFKNIKFNFRLGGSWKLGHVVNMEEIMGI
jgi:hypothetical protein